MRLLSDMDDTFVHSGYGLGGPKYPKGTVMPGTAAVSFKAANFSCRYEH